MPVELYLRRLKEKEFIEDNEDVCINKFVWNPSNVQAFKDSFNSDEARTRLEHAINMIDVDRRCRSLIGLLRKWQSV